MRAYSTASLFSLAVPGDQLQLDLFSIPSDDFRFVHGQAKFSAPLNDDGLRVAVSASRGDSFRRFDGPNQRGKSRQLIADLAYPFVKSRVFSLVGHASLGDWKSKEELSDITFQRDRYQVARGWVEFSRVKKTRIDGRFGISQGLDLGSATEAGDLGASRPFAGARFTKFNADVQVATALSQRVVLRLDATAQYSTKPLLAAEEFALGGSRIGRAFDFNEVAGDHGFGELAEIRYALGDTKPLKSLEVFAFADGGGAFRKRSFLGLPDEQWLAGAGGGLRVAALGLLWSGEFGVPIARSRVHRDPRLFFSVVKSF
jgi:hemolysin activation/secretion protein